MLFSFLKGGNLEGTQSLDRPLSFNSQSLDCGSQLDSERSATSGTCESLVDGVAPLSATRPENPRFLQTRDPSRDFALSFGPLAFVLFERIPRAMLSDSLLKSR
jgi:hypothetical protein